jgi:sulfur transfer complex TusBCD TusB component (DsrH family)
MIDAARPCDRCTTPPPSLASHRRCVWLKRAANEECDDGDALTSDDVCTATGECRGTASSALWQPIRIATLPYQFVAPLDDQRLVRRRITLLDTSTAPLNNESMSARVFVPASSIVPLRIVVLRGSLYIAEFACAFALNDVVDWCQRSDVVLLGGSVTKLIVNSDVVVWSNNKPLYIVAVSDDVQFRLVSKDNMLSQVSIIILLPMIDLYYFEIALFIFLFSHWHQQL